jgi:hypothetical protein
VNGLISPAEASDTTQDNNSAEAVFRKFMKWVPCRT